MLEDTSRSEETVHEADKLLWQQEWSISRWHVMAMPKAGVSLAHYVRSVLILEARFTSANVASLRPS